MAENLTWSATKHDEIIKRLMNDIGQPNSQSLYCAFKQFANELCALNADAPAALPAGVVSVQDALRDCTCPRPMNSGPDDLTVGDCVDKGQCGCQNGVALKHAHSAAISDGPVACGEPAALVDREACAAIADRYDGWQAENIAAQIRATPPAAPTTSPEPDNQGLFSSLSPEQQKQALSYRGEETHASPEPSAIFHATGLAGERLARITAPEPDAVRDLAGVLAAELAPKFDRYLHEKSSQNGADLRQWFWDNKAGVLAALSGPVAGAWQAPDGWKLVPAVPTKAQLDAGTDNNPTQWTDGTDPGFAIDVANDIYVSMVRAAPAAPRNDGKTRVSAPDENFALREGGGA